MGAIGRLDLRPELELSAGLAPLDGEAPVEPVPDPGDRDHQRTDDDQRQGPDRARNEQAAEQQQNDSGQREPDARPRQPPAERHGGVLQPIGPRCIRDRRLAAWGLRGHHLDLSTSTRLNLPAVSAGAFG